MLRWILIACLLGSVCATAEPLSLKHYATVTVEPTKTSIYVGTVRLAMPTFERNNGVYVTSYEAKVFPYFFYNEQGRIWIELSDEQLRELGRGQRAHFTGRAENSTGEERRVEGHATPDDATSGKIKVRVFVTKSTELIFNTTYRFAPR